MTYSLDGWRLNPLSHISGKELLEVCFLHASLLFGRTQEWERRMRRDCSWRSSRYADTPLVISSETGTGLEESQARFGIRSVKLELSLL
jgi:hypothetical protein